MECRIRIHLTPRASRDQISGWKAGVLQVRVVAPPVDGQANAALEKLLARALRLPRSAIAVASGQASRDKTLIIAGLSLHDATTRINTAFSK
jgi:uncharacterized protein (TIGR00251 family)